MAGLVFVQWVRTCILHDTNIGIGTETSLSERSSAVIPMEHREGTVDGEVVHWHPALGIHKSCEWGVNKHVGEQPMPCRTAALLTLPN